MRKEEGKGFEVVHNFGSINDISCYTWTNVWTLRISLKKFDLLRVGYYKFYKMIRNQLRKSTLDIHTLYSWNLIITYIITSVCKY